MEDIPIKTGKLALLSRIQIRTSLNVGMSKVKKKLDCYPAIVKISDGSSPRYAIRIEENPETRHIFEFNAKYITLETYSKISPLYSLSNSLLKLLAVSAFLSPEYSFYIESLFQYIVVALLNIDSKPLPTIPEKKESVGASRAYLILAKRINKLREEVIALKAENERIASLTDKLVSEIILFEAGTGSVSAEMLEKKYGISHAHVESAVRLLKSNRYLVTYRSKDVFSVVRV